MTLEAVAAGSDGYRFNADCWRFTDVGGDAM